MKEKDKIIKNRKLSKESSSEFYDVKKNSNDIILKSKIVSKLLNSFTEKVYNKYFDSMSSDLIDFLVSKENNENININKSNEVIFKNSLFNLLEKNLIEIIYITKADYREEKIKKLFNWYKEQIKLFEDIKYINNKSYIDPGSLDDKEYFRQKFEKTRKDEYITEDSILKEQMSHRTQGPFDKKLLKDYNRVHVYNNPYYKKLQNKNKSYQLKGPKEIAPINLSNLLKGVSPSTTSSSFLNQSFGGCSTFYTSIYGTSALSLRKTYDTHSTEKPEGGEKERTFHSKLNFGKKFTSPDISKEIKSCYSFNRPPIDFNLLNAEKEINDNKLKFVSQKRNEEEIKKKLEKFGIGRAHYNENILKKNDLKKIINMYIKTKKINSNILKKYKKKSNNLYYLKNNILDKTANPDLFEKTSTINKDENNYRFNPKINSIKEICQLTPKTDDLLYKENNIFKSEIDKKDNLQFSRLPKRRNTFGDLKISKHFRRMGNKMIVEEIKNIDKETNIINDKPIEEIQVYNINLKYQSDLIKQKLIKNKINSESNNNKTSNDVVYKLISEESLFKQKMLSDNLCNVKAKMNDKRFMSEPMKDESIYHNFCLSAYNSKNMRIIDKYDNTLKNDIRISKYISPYTKHMTKKKLFNENDSFNNYKDNYLNLRKTIGEWKKYECEQLLYKINKTNNKEGKDEESINKDKNNKNKDPLVYKINKSKKQKILINAIMNPNEDNTFPKYYLPKSGTNLLSKSEISFEKKKKNKHNNIT